MPYAIDGRYIQDHFPGIGRYTYNLIDALARVEPPVPLVVLHNPALKNSRYDLHALARFPNVELRRTTARTFTLQEQFQLPLSNLRLLHSPYYVEPYLVRVPSVVTIFDLIPLRDPSDLPNPAARILFRWMVALAARTAQRIIAPSIATRDDLVTLLNVPREKIDVVPLAADKRFTPQAEFEIARMREKYKLSSRYILNVGINKPHKNLGVLTQAWTRAQIDATLVIAGAWDERYSFQVTDRVRVIRNVDDADLPALYSGAQLFVMPSLYEGFGLTPLEAMACGAPVACSNVSSLPEVVGNAALLFDPRDVDDLALTIARVLSDETLREHLRIQSRARARHFSWERTARETLQVYRAVVRD